MEILNELFGSAAKVKIMKLFLMNPETILPPKDITIKTKIAVASARKELNSLKKIHFIKQKTTTIGKKKIRGWQLNPDFPIIHPLRKLLASSKVFTKQGLARRFKDVGRVKLVIVSGVFIQEDGGRVDLFVVGDSLRPNKVDTVIRKIEADLGKELKYAVCDTGDFIYRLNAYDKFIRDILDNPHEIVLDKVGIEGL